MSVDKNFYLAIVLSCLSRWFINFFWHGSATIRWQHTEASGPRKKPDILEDDAECACGRDASVWEGCGRSSERGRKRRTQELCRSRERDVTMNGSGGDHPIVVSITIQRTVCRYFSNATSVNAFIQTKKMHISFDTDSKDRKPQGPGDVPATLDQQTTRQHASTHSNTSATTATRQHKTATSHEDDEF